MDENTFLYPAHSSIPDTKKSAIEATSSTQQGGQNQDGQKQRFSPSDNLMRLIILCIASVFVVMGFIDYMHTGNAVLLIGTSGGLARPFYIIVEYYFFDKRKRSN